MCSYLLVTGQLRITVYSVIVKTWVKNCYNSILVLTLQEVHSHIWENFKKWYIQMRNAWDILGKCHYWHQDFIHFQISNCTCVCERERETERERVRIIWNDDGSQKPECQKAKIWIWLKIFLFLLPAIKIWFVSYDVFGENHANWFTYASLSSN